MTISSRRPAVARTRTHPFETSGLNPEYALPKSQSQALEPNPSLPEVPGAGVAYPIASSGTLYLFERGDFMVLWAGLLPTVLPTACKSEPTLLTFVTGKNW
jgi:hypothetical protein